MEAEDRLMGMVLERAKLMARGCLRPDLREFYDSEDIGASVTAKMLPAVREFEYQGDAQFFGYLKMAVLNNIRNKAQKLGKVPRPVDWEAADMAPQVPCIASGDLPDQAAIEAELTQMASEVLAALPPRAKAVVEMRRDGTRWAQISKRLGYSEKTAQSDLDKAEDMLGFLRGEKPR
jgi:RNA polymerase sigma factor (sigma-70 family)